MFVMGLEGPDSPQIFQNLKEMDVLFIRNAYMSGEVRDDWGSAFT